MEYPHLYDGYDENINNATNHIEKKPSANSILLYKYNNLVGQWKASQPILNTDLRFPAALF